MVNLKVKYCTSEAELNSFLEKFDLQVRDSVPALQRISYLVNDGKIYAVVEYADGELILSNQVHADGLPPTEASVK